MKKSLQFITLLSAFTLLSCGAENNSSSPSSGDSSSNPSSSSSEPLTKEECEKKIDLFLNDLASLEKNVSSFSYESTQSDYYYAVTIDTKVVGTKTLYEGLSSNPDSGASSITIDKYKYYQDSDDVYTDCETQTFLEGDRLYILNHYDDDSVPDSKNTLIYDEELFGGRFDLSFQREERDLLTDYQNYFDVEGTKIVDVLLPSIKGDGTFNYSYGLEYYQEGVKTQSIVYKNQIVISNNQITKAKREMVNNKYVRSEVINSTTSTVERLYSYGDPSPYSGTLFDPNDFPTSNS